MASKKESWFVSNKGRLRKKAIEYLTDSNDGFTFRFVNDGLRLTVYRGENEAWKKRFCDREHHDVLYDSKKCWSEPVLKLQHKEWQGYWVANDTFTYHKNDGHAILISLENGKEYIYVGGGQNVYSFHLKKDEHFLTFLSQVGPNDVVDSVLLTDKRIYFLSLEMQLLVNDSFNAKTIRTSQDVQYLMRTFYGYEKETLKRRREMKRTPIAHLL